MHALSCISGNKVFDLELVILLQPCLPPSMQGTQKTLMLNYTSLNFQQRKDTINELYQVVVKSCNRLFVTITSKDILYRVGNGGCCECETVSREVFPQMEIPEKWTQEPPCFAITAGVRLRSHTKKYYTYCLSSPVQED